MQNHLGLEKSFADGIRQAASDALPFGQKLASSKLDQWQRWSKEIFADLFSIMVMGPWALRAIVEAELGPAVEMVKPKRDDPALAIRLALMREAIRVITANLGEAWKDGLDGFDLAALIETSERTRRDMGTVPKAIEFGLSELGAIGKLQDLCGLAHGIYSSRGEVEKWGNVLMEPKATRKENELESARHVASGSLSAWAALTSKGEVAEDKHLTLAARTIDTLINSAQPGNRAKFGPRGLTPGKGTELVSTRLAAARSVRELDAEVE